MADHTDTTLTFEDVLAKAKQAYISGEEPTMGDFVQDLPDAVRSTISFFGEEHELANDVEWLEAILGDSPRIPASDQMLFVLARGQLQSTLEYELINKLQQDPEIQAKMRSRSEEPIKIDIPGWIPAK